MGSLADGVETDGTRYSGLAIAVAAVDSRVKKIARSGGVVVVGRARTRGEQHAKGARTRISKVGHCSRSRGVEVIKGQAKKILV